jgi:hypothetical protein
MTIFPFQHFTPPTRVSSFEMVTDAIRRTWDALYQLRKGKLECVTEVTLTAGAATTVLIDSRISFQSVIIFDPKTANAAAEKAAGTLYILTANRVNGQITITHANNAQTDREYFVAIIG